MGRTIESSPHATLLLSYVVRASCARMNATSGTTAHSMETEWIHEHPAGADRSQNATFNDPDSNRFQR